MLIFLEDECPRVTVTDHGLVHSVNEVFDKEFRATAAAHEFRIKGMPFTLHGFRLTTPKLSRHKLVYSANQRGVVSDKLEMYVPNLNTRLVDRDGNSFVYLGIVQSPYLTQHVNPARTDFDFASGDDGEVDQVSLFDDEIKRSEIRDKSLKHIEADLREAIQSINEVKEERLRNYVKSDAPQYKILMKYTPEFIDKISPNATKTDMETALHRELYQREVKMKAEGLADHKGGRKSTTTTRPTIAACPHSWKTTMSLEPRRSPNTSCTAALFLSSLSAPFHWATAIRSTLLKRSCISSSFPCVLRQMRYLTPSRTCG